MYLTIIVPLTIDWNFVKINLKFLYVFSLASFVRLNVTVKLNMILHIIIVLKVKSPLLKKIITAQDTYVKNY